MSDPEQLYAVIHLMGRSKIAGRITKDALFGLVRVDVPATGKYPAFTREYGKDAIFEIDYVSEEIVQRTAEAMSLNPIQAYAPDLITKEQFEEAKANYEKRLSDLRSLPERAGVHLRGDSEDDEDDDDNRQQGIPF